MIVKEGKMNTKNKLTELEQAILGRHPNWPQEKARWLAEKALGIIR